MTRPSSITCQVLHTSDDHGDGGDELDDAMATSYRIQLVLVAFDGDECCDFSEFRC